MKELTMIGNAHLDPVWLWNWQEGFQEIKATFRSALDRMKEYDDFYFTCGATIYYKWIEENCPSMFEEIKKRVIEGRWEIVGGWLIQPDCNLPSGESFVRQSLYGQRYYKSRFGKYTEIGYNVDSFGHNANIPQILKKSGMNYYVFMRPMPNEMAIPSRNFNWKSKDGSEVKAYRIPFEYCTSPNDLEMITQRYIEELKSTDHLMAFYGVGNHGGGPTKKNIESIKKMDDDILFPKMKMNTCLSYFRNLPDNDVTISNELQHHASGCYSVHSEVKKLNRKSENALVRAEKICVISNFLNDKKYPNNFDVAWENVLFNQFHDILAGCSIKSAYDDARNFYGESLSIAQKNENSAFQSISWDINIPTELEMVPIVVFNPNGFDDNVIVELEGRNIKNGQFEIRDFDNNIIPSQAIISEATVTNQQKILFRVNVKALGYKTVKLYKNKENQVIEKSYSKDLKLENDKMIYKFSELNGAITSIYDKQNEIEILRSPAMLNVYEDEGDTWSHDIYKFDKLINPVEFISIDFVESGDVRTTICVKSKFNDSIILQYHSLYENDNKLYTKMQIDWREPRTILKLKLPLDLIFRQPTYEIPYSFIERNSNGEEQPGQNWVDLSGVHQKTNKLYGLSIINDAKYSYDINNNEIGLTIIKNSVFAHHDPEKLKNNVEYEYVDNQRQDFEYIINPHEGTWKSSDTPKVALSLNQKPISIIETFHDGNLPIEQSFININVDNVILGTLKKAEEDSNYIVRLVETHGISTKAIIEIFGEKIEINFEPTEIVTIKFDKEQKTFKIVNLLEE